MNDKFSDEALQKAWQNFQKKHKDVSGRINEDLKKKSFSMARSMYQAVGINFSSASGSLNNKQKALVVRQAIDGVIMANNDICEWQPGRDAVYIFAEFACRSIMAQGRKPKPRVLTVKSDATWVLGISERLAELSRNHDLFEAA